MDPFLIVSIVMAALGCFDLVKDFLKRNKKENPDVALQNHYDQNSPQNHHQHLQQNSNQDKIRVTSESSEVLQPRDGRAEKQNVHWSSIADLGAHGARTTQEANAPQQQTNEIEKERNQIWCSLLRVNQVYAVFKIMSIVYFGKFDTPESTSGFMSTFRAFVLYVAVSFLIGVLVYARKNDKKLNASFLSVWIISTFAATFSVLFPLYPGFVCYIMSCLVIWFLIVLSSDHHLNPDIFEMCFVIFIDFCPFLGFFYYLFA